MSQNIDVYEEDDNTGREEHYMTSTPLPTPPNTPEDFMHEDSLFEMAYNNNPAFCATPTPPLKESHDQTIRHETDATTLYAPTPIQVKSCEFFFFKSRRKNDSRKHAYNAAETQILLFP